MKVVIQIPCFNEENTLADAVAKIPRKIAGVDEVELQIIDDGCTDGTAALAKKLGIDYIVKVPGRNRRWLGRAFKLGIEHALAVGADIVVNTDGDNQYPAERISDLIRPILDKEAQIVIGDRNPSHYKEFSPIKRALQGLGNLVFRALTTENVRDAVSGFRAYSKEALLQINIVTNYTYTVDTLMQAYKKGIDIAWIEINPNPKTRESRLITSIFSKVRKSGTTILRMFTIYTPFKCFLSFAALPALIGVVLLGRFGYFFLIGNGDGHIQSVIVGAVSLVIALQILMLGIIADLISVNRALVEDSLKKIKLLDEEIRTLKKD